jgi:cytochrome c oxidase cbb3-type subunit 3
MSIARCLIVAALSLGGLGFSFGGGPAPARQVVQDDEDAAFREAVVHRSLEENCLICHTEDMIAGQRLTPSQWKAEVDKMIGWGAPLPKEAAEPLVEYLAKRYSDREAPPVPHRSRLRDVDSYEVPRDHRGPIPEGGDPARGERLYAANCATCHGSTGLGGDLGPALVNKAILDRPQDYDRIVTQGLRRMPGTRLTLNATDQAEILAWLRHLSYPGPIGR